jgi:hypothetical protein
VLDATFVAEETTTARHESGFHNFWSMRTSETTKERDIVAQSAVVSLGGTGTRVNASRQDAILESAIKVSSSPGVVLANNSCVLSAGNLPDRFYIEHHIDPCRGIPRGSSRCVVAEFHNTKG